MLYRQVPYCIIGQDNGQTRSTNLQTLQGICKSTAFSDEIAEGGCVFRIKTKKPRRGNRPGSYPNYFLKTIQGTSALVPYLNEDKSLGRSDIMAD